MTTSGASGRLAAAVARRHVDAFGAGAPRVFFAPGRVDLIGAHLDYNGGDVLALAVDRGIHAAATLRDDGVLRLRSLDDPHAVDLTLDALGTVADPAHGWAAYPLGVVVAFAARTGRRSGMEIVVGGDLPIAAGLSSSAALEVVTAVALDALLGTGLRAVELARIAHAAETRFVGVPCGIMDQYAVALGCAGHALLLHCADASHEHVPCGVAAFEILVMDTRQPRRLAASGYAERVRACAAAHRALRAGGVRHAWLAEYTPAEIEAARDALPATAWRRARHVATEAQRVAASVTALRAGDLDALGAAMDASHASACDDYEVSTEALDAVTAAARGCPGVLGARLCGAGFGGCAIALVVGGAAAAVAVRVRAVLAARAGAAPRMVVVRAGGGPREV